MTREDKLIRRMEQGDSDAVDGLIALYYPEILRYCLWHAPNRSLAEDATQETFMKVLRHFDSYTHRGKFKSFLYQVAANTCIDMKRKKWMTDISLEEIPTEFSYIEKGFEEALSKETLHKLIRNLPEALQEIVILRFSQDLTMREIAKITDIPLRTAQSRLRTALKRLKKELQDENTPCQKEAVRNKAVRKKTESNRKGGKTNEP